MTPEARATELLDVVLDTYGDNLSHDRDGTIMVDSRWGREMRSVMSRAIREAEIEALEWAVDEMEQLRKRKALIHTDEAANLIRAEIDRRRGVKP